MEILNRRYKISPLIVAVIFISFFHNVLSRHKIRHFKDRFKRQQGANLYLPGSYVEDNNDPETGPWQEWLAPSPCSRTCGGGVATQSRKCTEGYDCTGPSTRHFSCNTQDCPDIADFRSQQCADHNNISFEGTYYKWVPYTKAPNQCELNCMPQGERFYYRHADAVIDGTRCNDEEFNVCVQGKCQPVGCDMMLGSNAREDQCRVCGGDGSTCNTFTNTIEMKDMQVGYNDILLIPAGATNIRIEEMAPTNNYLAVRNKTGFYYLNGNWRIDFPKSIDFAGTRFKYERQPQEFDAPDILTAIGPTDESLFIVLLYQGSDIPISYSYSLPTSLPPPSTERYSWIYDEYTPCSAKCGKGLQYRNVSCAGRNSLEPVDETLCDKESKPQAVQSCNEFDCEPSWIINPWSNCSYPCGEGGIETRQVYCQKIASNGMQEIVNDDNCSKSASKPVTEQKCNVGKICATWHKDPWKPCDHLCGPGKQTRKVICYVDKNGRKEILNDDDCIQIEPKPEEEKACNIRPCEGVDWLASQWSGCDQCGLTNETRKVFCASVSGEIQSDDLCDQERKPEIIKECEVANSTCQYLWYASQWSECSTNCGQGVQTRTIFCGMSTVDGVKKAEKSNCDPSKNFETIKNCTGEKETCDGEWFSGPWGECSKSCGGGERTKKVVCVKENQVVDASSCDASNIEFSAETCNQQPCSEDTIIPTDITQAVDESEPTKELSQKKESNTTPVTESSKDTENTVDTEPSNMNVFEISTGKIPITTENPDDYEIVPDDNCDDGEWVNIKKDEQDTNEQSDMPQEDERFDFDDIMLGDQGLLVGSGDGEESSSSSSTWSTDSSSSSDSTWSTDSSSSSDSTWSTDSSSSSDSTLSTDSFSSTESSTGSEFKLSTINDYPLEVEQYEITTTTRDSTTDFTKTTELSDTTTADTTKILTEFTVSSESTESTTPASAESQETTAQFTGSTESLETTDQFTGSTESTESVTGGSTETITDFTEPTDSTSIVSTETTNSPAFTESTVSSESTIAGSPQTTTEFTGSTETTESKTEGSTESTTEFTGSTATTKSTSEGSTETTTEFTGSTESTESTSEGLTESTSEKSSDITTEFTGSTESTQSTTVGLTESTTEFTGSTLSSESTTEGLTESTTKFTGSTELTESTTEGSTENTSEFTGSTVTTESTTEGSTESSSELTESTSVTTEITSEVSTESTSEVSTESTSEVSTESTSEESTESTTEGSTESSTEGSTESSTEGSTESTTEFTGSTGSTESTTEGSTESTKSTTAGSTESTIEFTGSTESTESTMEFTGSTESSSSLFDIFTKKPRMCKRRKVKKCLKTKFGCCWDNITPAEGPFDKGCPTPHTCKEAKYGCCEDNVSAALGPKKEGCPGSQCKETLFGCCSDNKTPSGGNDNEGCPPKCLSSEFGCCDDNFTQADGPNHEGCSEESTTEISTTEFSTTEFSTVSGETEITSEYSTEIGETGSTLEVSTMTENCETSIYRCCPDDVTSATGPGFQGCNLPCSDAKFGCCQDAKTPAHGPSGEGCCLSSPFGCCPDNIIPAGGPNNYGCDCSISPYGCCPDNRTAAQGYEKEGCGCKFTEFGCCSDGYTKAQGPEFQGCQCHTFQFGCCPDGINSAKGPHGQGCGCRNSEFGCCSDEKTPASGPKMEGCSCENTKFGCCLDGTTEAKGENFEGCEIIPQNLQVGCSIPKERGQCRNYTVKWFFDMDYGGCSRFWYGGCDGNENRYKSKEECEQICVIPEGEARCHLPKVSGPCEGYYPQWYYDKDLKNCAQFIYGGCLGNNNRFETREECLGLCVKESNSNPCQQIKNEGPCQGQYQRYFFNKESGECQDFIYGGCKGNNNNFATIEACKQQCAPVGDKKDYCTEPKAEGNCTEVFATWYYDAPKKSCAPFYFTGCNGNLNNFDDKETCETQCPPEIEKDTCQLPAEVGECGTYVDRWYYDTREKSCRQFYYGGCGGNGNNFETQQRCQERCENKALQPQTTPQPQPAQPQNGSVSTIDKCFQPRETGPCRGAFTKYFYDASDGVCKDFIYGGCQGNANNFNSIEECLQLCGNAKDLCTLPAVQGSCGGKYPQYYYDQASDSCQQFEFSGCGGNYNRFQDQQSCEQKCKKSIPPPTYTQAPTSASQAVMCFESPDPGNCDDRVNAFYYDPTRRICQPFIYSGCGGNNNRFNSEEQCQRQCGEFMDQDICKMQRDPGPCRGYFVKYYYDASTRRCDQFAYGGCQGNGNRFSSEAECSQICITHEESKPNITAAALCRLPVDTGSCEEAYHKRWYFDDSKGECLAFIFSGCGGNFNNFKSFQHCIDYCREFLPPPFEPQYTTDQPPHPCQEAFDECTNLRCPYGVEPFVDENDCNRCRCRDPCAEVACLKDEQCAIDLNRNKTSSQDADFIAICRKQNKPGYCPSLEINDNNCEEECRTDADCTLHLKCCSTGCGTACIDPTPPAQLVTQQPQPAFTNGPFEAQFQPPQVNTVEYKPEVSASIGDQATLRCAVSGNPNPKIRWSKENIEIDGTQPRYRIKLDQSLQIITLHKTDSGIYLCTAQNGVGDPLTNQIKLEVLDSEPRPVSILAEPGDEQPVIVSLNAPSSLNCYVLGYPFPAVTWWKDDSIIPFKNNEYEIRKDYSLLIHSVKLENLGIYTCQAYNGYGKAASWSVTVKTRGPINFNHPIDEQYNKFIIYPEEYSPTTPSSTTPKRVHITYPYTPYNPFIPVYTEPSNEIIPDILPDTQATRPEPSITVPVRANITTNDQKYPVGSDIEIPCEFTGYPAPQIKWFKDGVELLESEKIHIRESERTSILRVEKATKADSGYYQCEAINAYNRASSALEISINGMYIDPSCTDNQFFANCDLIVKAKFCTHKYYAKFCCRSCTEAGLLPVDGPHLPNFNRQNFLDNNLI